MWKKGQKAELVDMEIPPMGHDLGIMSNQAILGPSITVHGELSGSEDLTIQGIVEGAVHLKNHCLTVGQKGQIQANIYAKDIKVDGEVNGDLTATDQVCVRKTGVVNGNIQAKRVVMEDGCQFKGRIDMDVVSPSSKDSLDVGLSVENEEEFSDSLTNISGINIEKEDALELKSVT